MLLIFKVAALIQSRRLARPFHRLLPRSQEFIAKSVIPIRYFQQCSTASFVFLSARELAHFPRLVVIMLGFNEWSFHVGDFE